MSTYKKAYTILFNGVTDVIRGFNTLTSLQPFMPPAVDRLIRQSIEVLKHAQQRSEECYISKRQTKLEPPEAETPEEEPNP